MNKDELLKLAGKPVFIVFDGSPGPVAPSFIEVETADGASVSAGEWHEYPKDIAMHLGMWRLGPLYTEAQLLAIYTKGAEGMRELAAKLHDGYFMQLRPLDPCSNEIHRAISFTHKAYAKRIRALPITTNTEGVKE